MYLTYFMPVMMDYCFIQLGDRHMTWQKYEIKFMWCVDVFSCQVQIQFIFYQKVPIKQTIAFNVFLPFCFKYNMFKANEKKVERHCLTKSSVDTGFSILTLDNMRIMIKKTIIKSINCRENEQFYNLYKFIKWNNL